MNKILFNYAVVALLNFLLQRQNLDHFSVAQGVFHNTRDILH